MYRCEDARKLGCEDARILGCEDARMRLANRRRDDINKNIKRAFVAPLLRASLHKLASARFV